MIFSCECHVISALSFNILQGSNSDLSSPAVSLILPDLQDHDGIMTTKRRIRWL